MNKKLVFLDIDGTLVGYDAKIPPSALEALSRAQTNGHRIFIASGRARGIVYPWLLEAFPFDGMITAGGAQVFLDGKCIYESIMSEDDLTFAIDYFHRMGVYFTAASASNTYAEQAFVDVVLPAMKKAGYDDELVDKTFRDVIILDSLTGLRDIEKMSFFLSRRNVDQICADLDGRFYVTDYSMGDAVVDTYFGEMNLAGVDKGSGIHHILDATGTRIEDTIAIGDSRNDTEMLAVAGTAVAMGNATEPIKAMAHLVTTPIDQDGIYNAFLSLGLI
jgi:Cof subfamily protein (haloacid dehalogenase superfamily)